MNIEASTKCAHPACGCSKEKDSNYCCQSCKDAADLTEVACHCGHTGCSTAARVASF